MITLNISDAMRFDEIQQKLQAHYNATGRSVWSASDAFDRFLQDGETPGSTNLDGAYAVTRFDLPYCSDDERDVRDVFGGTAIYSLVPLDLVDDGWSRDDELYIVL